MSDCKNCNGLNTIIQGKESQMLGVQEAFEEDIEKLQAQLKEQEAILRKKYPWRYEIGKLRDRLKEKTDELKACISLMKSQDEQRQWRDYKQLMVELKEKDLEIEKFKTALRDSIAEHQEIIKEKTKEVARLKNSNCLEPGHKLLKPQLTIARERIEELEKQLDRIRKMQIFGDTPKSYKSVTEMTTGLKNKQLQEATNLVKALKGELETALTLDCSPLVTDYPKNGYKCKHTKYEIGKEWGGLCPHHEKIEKALTQANEWLEGK